MATFKSVKTLSEESFKVLKDQFGYKNIMQAPRLTKVVVSVGTGSFKDKKKQELVADRLAKITGQKPVIRKAKQAIASYKTRIGDPIGYQVTIRGARMIGFLDKLLHVSLPRTKDFRGSDRCAHRMPTRFFEFVVGFGSHGAHVCDELVESAHDVRGVLPPEAAIGGGRLGDRRVARFEHVEAVPQHAA
jgi:hypothetical protein